MSYQGREKQMNNDISKIKLTEEDLIDWIYERSHTDDGEPLRGSSIFLDEIGAQILRRMEIVEKLQQRIDEINLDVEDTVDCRKIAELVKELLTRQS